MEGETRAGSEGDSEGGRSNAEMGREREGGREVLGWVSGFGFRV